ncbi:MAG TPA: class I SAM-dependent methyltransferase [Polyangiaceae bacterium]|nr:class I SAM-dependent methyltransferase [Polyangiaceae bacterium]
MSQGSLAGVLPPGSGQSREPFYSAVHDEEQESIACPLCGAEDERLVFLACDTMFNQVGRYRHVACARCSMRYVNPRPTMAALARHYPEEYLCYTNLEREHWLLKWAFARLQRDQAKRRVRQIEQVAGRIAASTRALDVGCGRGELVASLKRHRGCDVTGLDINVAVVERVRRELAVDVHHGTLCGANYSECSFDLLTMTEYLEHEAEPRRVIDEAWRVLKPGGILAIEVPDVSGPMGRLFGAEWWQVDAPRHLTFFSPATLTRMLESAGFEVLKVRRYGLVMSFGYSLLQALGFRYFRSNKLLFLTLSTLIGIPLFPLLFMMPDFMMTVARRRHVRVLPRPYASAPSTSSAIAAKMRA